MDDITDRDKDSGVLLAVLIIVLTVMAALTGALFAVTRYPEMLPGLANSILGTQPKAFWYLSRATALTSFFLLWLSMAMGISITNRLAKVWPGGPSAFELHEFFSLLGLAFALFHAAILMGDRYIHYGLTQVFVPFTSQEYRPFWVGLGQISFYIWGIVSLSFYLRKRVTTPNWRLIHYASYLVFGLALVHGIMSGTDSGLTWSNIMYWTSSAALLFLLLYRILVSLANKQKRPAITSS
jgi:predicted ferric reductase